MKIILILVLLAAPAASHAQSTITEYWPNGKKKSERTLLAEYEFADYGYEMYYWKNALEEDLYFRYITWYESGQKKSEEYYFAGSRTERCTYWNEDGTIAADHNFINVIKEYRDTARPIAAYTVNKCRISDILYYSPSQATTPGAFRAPPVCSGYRSRLKKNGATMVTDSVGNRIAYVKLDDEWNEWYPDGKKKFEGKLQVTDNYELEWFFVIPYLCKNGTRTTWEYCKRWYPNGRLRYEYSDAESTWKFYSESGEVKAVMVFDSEKRSWIRK